MNKVVVMSAQDVAAMRKASREAGIAYFEAKVGALEFAVEEMKNSGREYTLQELSSMTGLTIMEIVAQMNGDCRAAAQAGVYRQPIKQGYRVVERNFVEIKPNGEINPNNIMTITRNEHWYKIDNSNR